MLCLYISNNETNTSREKSRTCGFLDHDRVFLELESGTTNKEDGVVRIHHRRRCEMGNCLGSIVAFAPEGKPECQRCGKVGPKEWHMMTTAEKGMWQILPSSEKYTVLCKSCSSVYKQEDARFEKEREYYSNAKAMLYPKKQHTVRLKRLKSAEVWEGTESFYESYRPPSTIAHLIDTEEGDEEQNDGLERKGTGMPVKQSIKGSGIGGDYSIQEETSLEIQEEEEEEEEGTCGESPIDTVLQGNFQDIVLVEENTLTDEDEFEAACEQAVHDNT